ncbi:hypothetical protein [Runella limosa]|uniref:hypothetical protein n=1 Tax=Runella limosa TaxID=370978 RepID=UPI0004282A96|nr:hypothetical protein [Runella limosa]
MAQIDKSFGDCTLLYLEKTFGLVQVDTLPSLTSWLQHAQQMELSDFENEDLALFQSLLSDNILHWNEQELSLHFIGPMFSLVRFTNRQHYFNLFAERPIETTLEDLNHQSIRLYGKPDGLIATGYREPESPFFCFTEYKKHREPNGEPEGQCLSAMLAGQAINQKPEQAMYGCFVMGRDWYFMTLENQSYCLSRGYDATTEHLYIIFKMLKALKEIIKTLTS